jgi:murein DD-endopeptidase MepM/ murein hydrolase activator NlpD
VWILVVLAVLLVGVITGGLLWERHDPKGAADLPPPTLDPAEGPAVSNSAPPTPTPSPTATATKQAPHYVFPVVGEFSYEHTHHDYPATDIIAPCGETVRATTDGVILEVNRVDKWKAATDLGPDRGGLSVSLLGDDGVRYYGSHFRAIAPNINPGVRVTAGEKIAEVGETGDAGVCHVHYGISPPCAQTGDWWVRRGEVWPWSFLDSWRAGGDLSPVATVSAFVKAHGCPPLQGIPEP